MKEEVKLFCVFFFSVFVLFRKSVYRIEEYTAVVKHYINYFKNLVDVVRIKFILQESFYNKRLSKQF